VHLSDEKVKSYFDELYSRRDTGERLEPKPWKFANGEVPKPNDCHVNVDRWVAENPEHSAARGWVIDGGMGEHYNFVAHSAVRTPSGELIDITCPKSLVLISHRGTPELFQSLSQWRPQIIWPEPPVHF
jgi:hypothetical protein